MEPISLICAVKRGRTDAEGESEVVLTIPLSSMPAYLRPESLGGHLYRGKAGVLG